MDNPIVLGWGAAAAAGAAKVGGKGWNLGRLCQFGFPVPRGGVITAEVYRRFMAQPALAALWRPLSTVTALDAAAPEVAERLAQIRTVICATELPPDITAALTAFLAVEGLTDTAVAVRSSATTEDSATASFAGIHQSFLGVRGAEAVRLALRQCYASLWTPQALAYRRPLGFVDEAVACAMVICAMVTGLEGGPPRAAGVAFSCDPRTGRRDLVTISAAPGLGEAVVSGSTNPEEIAVQWETTPALVTARTERTEPVLTDAEATALARLTMRVHWALGDGQDPQDIEWAHDGQRFWLLQARPVTRLPLRTFPELAHLPTIWSNANLKDVFPGVQRLLGWSIMQADMWNVLRARIRHPGGGQRARVAGASSGRTASDGGWGRRAHSTGPAPKGWRARRFAVRARPRAWRWRRVVCVCWPCRDV